MRSLGLSSVLFLACLAVLASGPAFARSVTVFDPAGDGSHGDRLDITSVKVANRDGAITTTVSVVRVAHGSVAVWIRARGDSRRSAVVVASSHRAGGDTSRLLSANGVVRCSGLGVTWDEATDGARVPARCLDHGDYGAVKVRTITEIHGGEDVDLAQDGPNGTWRWTDWVSRG